MKQNITNYFMYCPIHTSPMESTLGGMKGGLQICMVVLNGHISILPYIRQVTITHHPHLNFLQPFRLYVTPKGITNGHFICYLYKFNFCPWIQHLIIWAICVVHYISQHLECTCTSRSILNFNACLLQPSSSNMPQT